jgi:signal transduction histidine kinase
MPVLISAMLLINLGVLFAAFRLYFVQEIVDQLEKYTGKHFNYHLLRSSRIISSVMNFEIILIFIIVVIIGIIIHFSYAQPLTSLCASVKDYKKKTVPATKRRDEIGLLQNTFAEVTARLEEEKQIQTRMIASISHDIKTPLTSILGYSERLLRKDVPPERAAQYLSIIHGGAARIRETVEEFDSYIEGKVIGASSMRTFSIRFIEQMLLEEYAGELGRSGVAFSVENGCGADTSVRVDLSRLRRVFANLIGNAVRHNASVASLEIRISITRVKNDIAFAVANNGASIPEDDIGHIFEPFYTTEKTRSVSGLGLSICYDIIEAHGGEITAVNLPDGGCAFTFTLEAAPI